MSDQELRRLERMVAYGEIGAMPRLRAVRNRMGLCAECGLDVPRVRGQLCMPCALRMRLKIHPECGVTSPISGGGMATVTCHECLDKFERFGLVRSALETFIQEALDSPSSLSGSFGLEELVRAETQAFLDNLYDDWPNNNEVAPDVGDAFGRNIDVVEPYVHAAQEQIIALPPSEWLAELTE